MIVAPIRNGAKNIINTQKGVVKRMAAFTKCEIKEGVLAGDITLIGETIGDDSNGAGLETGVDCLKNRWHFLGVCAEVNNFAREVTWRDFILVDAKHHRYDLSNLILFHSSSLTAND